MTRYIDADRAISVLKRWFKFPDYNKGEKNIIACAINMLEETPTADVVERKRGKWIEDGYRDYPCVCSVCGIRQSIKAKFLFSYCPNCGADMRGEKDG